MTINIDENMSFESILDSLFSNESDKLDEHKKIELSDFEMKLVNAPIDEDTEVSKDEAESLSIEGINILNDVSVIQLGMAAFEKFQWSVSTESFIDSIEIVLKKFWDIIKSIFEKLRTSLLIAIRRTHIAISGNMRNVSKWAKKNKSSIEKGIDENGEEIFMYTKIPLHARPDMSEIAQLINESIHLILSKNQIKYENFNKLEEFIDTYSITTMDEYVYEDNKNKNISMKDYDTAIGGIVDRLINIDEIRSELEEPTKLINALTTNILSIKKMGLNGDFSKVTPDEAQKIRKYGLILQKSAVLAVNICYWSLSNNIYITKVAHEYAEKAFNSVLV